jgi:hypothetical protein
MELSPCHIVCCCVRLRALSPGLRDGLIPALSSPQKVDLVLPEIWVRSENTESWQAKFLVSLDLLIQGRIKALFLPFSDILCKLSLDCTFAAQGTQTGDFWSKGECVRPISHTAHWSQQWLPLCKQEKHLKSLQPWFWHIILSWPGHPAGYSTNQHHGNREELL